MTTQRPAEAPRRRRRTWIITGVVAAVIVAAVIAALVIVPPIVERRAAEDRYETAIAERDAARDAWEQSRAEVQEARPPADDALTLAEAVATDDAKPYLNADLFAEVTGLVDEITTIEDTLPDLADALAEPSEPDTTEEYLDAAERALSETETLEEGTAIFTAAADGFEQLVPDLESATAELRASIPEGADRLESENISSESVARIRLQHAADLAASSDENVAYYVEEYVGRAQDVEASQKAEMAEKEQGDGLADVRLEVEEFVRSITGDARVDFDWAPIVNGLGQGVSAGGVVEWQYTDGGYATMALSNSVAAYWPDERFESLVVHESGHVITSQCRDMLVDTFDGDVEMMATAWAIGMGYTNTWGNGVDFYYGGAWPPDDLIEASKACR